MRIGLLIITLFGAQLVFSQDLGSFNQERIDLTKDGMFVLGGWATANILINPILAAGASGSRKYFYQMNAYWNVVNLAIAGIGYYGITTQDPMSFSMAQSIKEQSKIEQLLLFNAGLDIAYVLGGLYLTERSKNISGNQDRLKGFGQAIMLQGAWLFSFDLVFYLVQKNHGGKLINSLSALSITPDGFTLALRF